MNKYKYLTQGPYADCQIITAINAGIFLGLPGVKQKSIEYERLIDLGACRHGAAISIERVINYLGLQRKRIPYSLKSFSVSLSKYRPVELCLWNKDFGYHSCLLIGMYHNEIETKLKIINYNKEKNKTIFLSTEVNSKENDKSWRHFKAYEFSKSRFNYFKDWKFKP